MKLQALRISAVTKIIFCKHFFSAPQDLTNCQNLITLQEHYACSSRIAVVSVNKTFLLVNECLLLAEIIFTLKRRYHGLFNEEDSL